MDYWTSSINSSGVRPRNLMGCHVVLTPNSSLGTEMENKSVVQTLIQSAQDPTKALVFNYASEALNNSFFLSTLASFPFPLHHTQTDPDRLSSHPNRPPPPPRTPNSQKPSIAPPSSQFPNSSRPSLLTSLACIPPRERTSGSSPINEGISVSSEPTPEEPSWSRRIFK